MTTVSLAGLSVEDLVNTFESMALAQDKALFDDEHARYNRLYDKMEVVKSELKSRAGDARHALMPLLNHANAQVRLKAAIALLGPEPTTAREALQRISDANEYPQAARARSMMSALDEGRYIPT